jgi:hydroxybutyrate-dimer hydrolase
MTIVITMPAAVPIAVYKHAFMLRSISRVATKRSRPLCVARATLAIVFAILPWALSSALASTPNTARRTASAASEGRLMSSIEFRAERVTDHRDGDDLLTAGLGLSKLRQLAPPPFADAAVPTASELRRRAIWSNWRGIADLSVGGGYGEVYGSTQTVPGREFSAYATVPGARHPHRVLAQVPDAFDHKRRCVVIAPSSGSRGVYGAIAVAGAWALPKGCVVAYTDKGTGTDYFDLATGIGARADGTSGLSERDPDLAFVPQTRGDAAGVAFKHAHSQDNPEADWGRHVYQAAQFALHALNRAFPEQAPFTFANTRTIAVGISNGGGAVLRAAELSEGIDDPQWLDAVVAGEPSVLIEGEGGRALYDYTTEAALWMPCALLHMNDLPQPPLQAQARVAWSERCAGLRALGVLEGDTAEAQAQHAYERMRANGWTDEALRAGALSVGFDLWRAVAVTYASAYGRYGVGEHPCAYSFGLTAADGAARTASAQERAAWWSDASGIPPGAGVTIIDGLSKEERSKPDSELQGLRCLRALWEGDTADADRVRKGIAATGVGLPRRTLPVMVIHGVDDGLIPMAFSSAPYVAKAKAAKRDVRFWKVRNAQHFDAFLGLPDYGARYLPMLPYVYAALDHTLEHLEAGTPMPGDATIDARPRQGQVLTLEHLAIP